MANARKRTSRPLTRSDSTQPFDNPSPEEAAFLDLVAACLQRVEKEGSRALEDFCARHPEHAEELRRVVAELSATGMLATQDQEPGEMFPDRLGEFHLLERIGVGGMGVVYRAEQGSLRRQVALKLIRPDYLYFPGARERLQREVEAVARLDHPGLVSVLTVGEDGGIPYFAMEFVNGCSVAQVLRHLKGSDPRTLTGADLRQAVAKLCPDPTKEADAFGSPHLFHGTWTQACTRIARMAAEALDHAHERGIVHRDIKPSNIMLTPGGRVLVVDFGLAMLQASPRLTRTGSTPGSAAYMAPEQVRGDAQDQRIDVYSLGVTLYEMLTLRHAFDGADAAEIQSRILSGQVESPRSINPAVSRDLRTVCLAAMEHDPGRRYPSCGHLARDLANLLERRPVLARRPGPFLRGVRWVQRHKAATAALVAAVAVPLSFLIQQISARQQIDLALHQAKENLRQAEENEQRAQENLRQARENFETALAAVDRLLGRMSHKKLRHVPQATEIRCEMLQDTLEFCEGLLRKEPENIDVLRRAAYTASVLGSLSMYRGRRKQAKTAYERAMSLYDKLVSISPEDRLTPVNKVCDFAAALVDLGDPQRALKLCDKAAAWCERFTAKDNEDGKAGAVRALINRQRALALHFSGRPRERDEAIDACIAGMEAVVKQHPGYTNHRFELGKCYILQGNHRRRRGELQAAEASYRRARKLLERVVEEIPHVQGAHANLGRALNSHASVLLTLGSFPEMEKVSRQAAEIFTALTRDYPEILDFQGNLGTAWHNLASALINQRKHREAADAIAKAITAQTRAHERRPDSERFVNVLSNHYYLQGLVLLRLRDHAGIAEAARNMVRIRSTTNTHVQAVALLAACADLADRDNGLDEARRTELTETYASAAEDHLEAAVQAGFRDVEATRAPGLRPLRQRPRFRRIVTRLRELQESGR